ncbi:hypothetical protein TEA_021474 [Camellia sinensis var. sinensis]|uniref:Sodium channel modifier 1 zinc-finger domain-containing protein n=1 Tax=Camellia sinensis var. sinensis TaxID=542762 RepID=A0A4S4CYV7_CAMSN|nr:hypothetical protein TEA_021474 [Camellia sinensis var. sinensis]
MSVFGGDGWVREAQYRKRRVDDLVVEGLEASSYRKLSSGKYACLVCPHNPILDTPLMLSMHIKGSRHRVAESRLKEKQQVIQDEINKRIALSECSSGAAKSSTSTQVNPQCRLVRKPLIEQTWRATSEILCNKTPHQSEAKGNNDVKSNKGHSTYEPFCSNDTGSSLAIEAYGNLVAQQQSIAKDFTQERRERESLQQLAGSVTVMGNGLKMKMLSLTLMKKIQTSVLHDKLRNHVDVSLVILLQD